MKRKTVSGLMLTLLVISMLTLAFNIQPVKASGTIYIRADGSVDPSTAPIQRDGDIYTLTGNITVDIHDGIVVERDNIVVDGAGYTVQGTGYRTGIYLSFRSNVTLKNVEVTNFKYGIYLYDSDNNILYGNTASSNSKRGIYLQGSSNNVLTGNTVSNNGFSGISLLYSSNNNVLSGNTASNNDIGISFLDSSNNVLTGNTASSNSEHGIYLDSSSNNTLFHNNLIDNTFQAGGYQLRKYVNTWDDSYPSGGNYWSDYAGADEKSGPYQNETDSDGIGDTSYVIGTPPVNCPDCGAPTSFEPGEITAICEYCGSTITLELVIQDNYPLMSPWTQPEHDLIVSITAPASITLGDSSSLNATVTNRGLSDESNVELVLLINGTILDSITVDLLQAGNSHTLSYLPWAPTVEGTYNVTAYAHPVPGETSVENNRMSKFVTVAVSPPSEVQVGVKAGDWIKCDYTVTGWPSGTPRPEWLKVEILSLEGTTATVRVTMHISDGTEQNDTLSVDVVAGGGTFDTLFGFVVPANCTTGDSINMGGDGLTFNVTIDGETTRTYAGASRTVVYASFSLYGTELTYYWDKETGVMVEASTTSGGITGTAKATETNMWEAQATPLWMLWWFYAIVAVATVTLAGAVYFLKKRKPPTPTAPTLPMEE